MFQMMSGLTREIVTLQVGHYANFVGTHWWNIQVNLSVLKLGLLSGYFYNRVNHAVTDFNRTFIAVLMHISFVFC